MQAKLGQKSRKRSCFSAHPGTFHVFVNSAKRKSLPLGAYDINSDHGCSGSMPSYILPFLRKRKFFIFFKHSGISPFMSFCSISNNSKFLSFAKADIGNSPTRLFLSKFRDVTVYLSSFIQLVPTFPHSPRGKLEPQYSLLFHFSPPKTL